MLNRTTKYGSNEEAFEVTGRGLHAKHPGILISLVSPGVVATEFDVHALHGGPDSRTMPNSQTAEEVAEVIAKVIETRRADVYTRPEFQQMIAGYYAAEDLDEVESKPPFAMAPPRP